MKTRYLLIGLVITSILTTQVIACDMCKKMLKNPEQSLTKQVNYISDNSAVLGLSNQQVEKVKSTFVDAKKDLIKLDADYRIAQLDLERALQKNPIDVNAAKNLIDRSSKASAEKMKRSVEAQANILKILTPKQKEKIKETCLSGHGDDENKPEKECEIIKDQSMSEKMKLCPIMMKKIQENEAPQMKEQK